MPKFKDLTGQTFGRLIVISREKNLKSGKATFLCKCECGNEKVIRSFSLIEGSSKSCGCLAKEIFGKTAKKNQYLLALSRRKEKGVSAKNAVFSTYKLSAKRRNYEFNLTFDEFINLTSQNCYYCGVIPSIRGFSKCYGSYIYNGIDRMDNNKGYILENCVPCCKPCNRSKGIRDFQEFISHAIKIADKYRGINI